VTKARLSAWLLPLLILLAACSDGPSSPPATGQQGPIATVAAPSFTALPGPSVAWRVQDPSFSPLQGARALAGVHMGAAYRIEVPERWNGELVVYGHGFRGFGPDLTVSDPPLRRYLIENGFAWAASSYRANGYVPGLAAEDSLALKDLFATLVGAPQRAYFYGTSMGGNAAMIIAEFFPRAFDGILSECGVVAGIELFDFFVASAAAAVYISGVDPSGLRAESADLAAAAAAVGRALTPELGPANDLNEKGRRLAEVMLNLSGGPRPFAAEGLAQFMYVDLAAGAGALLPGVSEESIGATLRAATNEDARYALHAAFGIDAAALNGGVVRKRADLTLRSRDGPYPELAPFRSRPRATSLSPSTWSSATWPPPRRPAPIGCWSRGRSAPPATAPSPPRSVSRPSTTLSTGCATAPGRGATTSPATSPTSGGSPPSPSAQATRAPGPSPRSSVLKRGFRRRSPLTGPMGASAVLSSARGGACKRPSTQGSVAPMRE
jgi:hypothetical protein